MAKKLVADTEFLYASGRLHAIEAKEDSKVLAKMLTAATADEAEKLFLMSSAFEVDSVEACEEAVFAIVDEVTPVSQVVDVFRLQYDCQNIKMAIKAQIRGMDGSYFTIGTLPVETVLEAVKTRDFSAFLPEMAKNAAEAMDIFAASNDPQMIDFLLDKACLADMLTLAFDSGCPFLMDWVQWKIDSANLAAILRGKKIGKSADFFAQVLADGGKLSTTKLLDAFLDGDDDSRQAVMQSSVYRDRIDITSPNLCEKSFLSYREQMIEDALRVTYGPQVVVGYLVNKMEILRKARMILSLKRRGMSQEEIQNLIS